MNRNISRTSHYNMKLIGEKTKNEKMGDQLA
jgi:hypothetical protein